MLLKFGFPKYLNKVVWQSPETMNSSIKESISVLQSKNTSLVGSESCVDVEKADSFSESSLQSLLKSERSSGVAQDLVVQSTSTGPLFRSLKDSQEIAVIDEDSLDDAIFTKLSSRRFGRRSALIEVSCLDGEISDSFGSSQRSPKKRKLS